MDNSTIHIYLNPVRADRAAAFEEFLERVNEAMEAQRPDLDHRWKVLKATAPEDGVITYAFVFDGGDLDTDWELGVLLPAHFGKEETDRMIAEWADTFASFKDWVTALGDNDEPITQVGWTFSVVRGG